MTYTKEHPLRVVTLCSGYKETWKPIKGYEGYYEVSDLGRVKSVARKISNGHGLVALPSVQEDVC